MSTSYTTIELRTSIILILNIYYIYRIPSSIFLMYYTLLKSIPMHIKSLTNTNNTPCTQRTFVENIRAPDKGRTDVNTAFS